MGLLLRGGSVLGEHPDRSDVSSLDDVGAARTDGGDRLDREHRIEQRPALPAVLLSDRDAEQALLGHQVRHVPWIAARMRALVCAGGEVLPGKTAHRIAELLLLWLQPEIHFIAPIRRDAFRAAPAAGSSHRAYATAGSPGASRSAGRPTYPFARSIARARPPEHRRRRRRLIRDRARRSSVRRAPTRPSRASCRPRARAARARLRCRTP